MNWVYELLTRHLGRGNQNTAGIGRRQSSPEMSTLANIYMRMTPEKLVEMAKDDPEGTVNDIKSLAASVMSQDETKGQG